ncbi:Oxidoreductase calI [Paramyrothecium foliicola]|nr:Oxidoreductase calI [Paramyrothecium foliicola]
MSRYAAAHADPQGPGDARPTALQIVQDESLEGKLDGKVIVITGASGGIGAETAKALFATGATLFVTGRDLKKAESNLSDILKSDRVSLLEVDTSSFASIRAAATKILAETNNRVNILINNAGIMAVPSLEITKDGFETHFATNHLGHFLLFELLKPALLASSTPDFQSRVVNVSSSTHRTIPQLVESDNYNFEKSEYVHMLAYANSKLANVYMASELERRYGSQGLHATSVHPGEISSDLLRNLGGQAILEPILSNKELSKGFKSPAQGAATTVLAAIGKEWENKGGRYLENCGEAERGKDDGQMMSPGWASHTYDPVAEKRLWEDSLRFIGQEVTA